jgi:Ca2+/Na+ antiporter
MMLYQVLGAVFVSLLALAFILRHFLCRRLKIYHHESWKELGAPTVFRTSIRKQLAFYKFVTSGRISELRDQRLSWMAKVEVMLTVVLWGLFLYYVVRSFVGPW